MKRILFIKYQNNKLEHSKKKEIKIGDIEDKIE